MPTFSDLFRWEGGWRALRITLQVNVLAIGQRHGCEGIVPFVVLLWRMSLTFLMARPVYGSSAVYIFHILLAPSLNLKPKASVAFLCLSALRAHVVKSWRLPARIGASSFAVLTHGCGAPTPVIRQRLEKGEDSHDNGWVRSSSWSMMRLICELKT